ncbi:hypothetical protein Goshw_018127 [Gossypium schwendimanii]|uniref:LysM domain-containing protein n=1 Tax=Gossypium schwendimanii TaxID=34291 RepID=A0A7J9MUU8_GOSSC|nr:hypothetical protein [Gossypium schwendimanii]
MGPGSDDLVLTTGCGGGSHSEIAGMEKKKTIFVLGLFPSPVFSAMEVKLTHKKHISPSKSLLSNLTKTTFPPHTLRLKPWAAAEIQHFQGLVKKWRLQNKTKDYSCAHVVKEGETLSSISKMYGVSVHSIAAANKNIVDINLVFQGQLLNIPSSSLLDTQLDRAKKSRLWQSIRALKAPSGQKFFTMITSHCLSNAKSTGYFLVLVPLIAFCIGCIISTLHTRVSRSIKHQAADKSQAHYPGAKGRRWKSALSDSVEGDVFDSELGLVSNVSTRFNMAKLHTTSVSGGRHDCDMLRLCLWDLMMPPDPENAQRRLHRTLRFMHDALQAWLLTYAVAYRLMVSLTFALIRFTHHATLNDEAIDDICTLIDYSYLFGQRRLDTSMICMSTSEDEANIQNEEASEDYGGLEHDYQKFLSECGISKWGYWRGGSPGA